jgi:hypothetical protein
VSTLLHTVNCVETLKADVDVDLISGWEIEMLADLVDTLPNKTFADIRYTTDLHYNMQSDDGGTDHTVFYLQNDNLTSGAATRAHLERGHDHTQLRNYPPVDCAGGEPTRVRGNPNCAEGNAIYCLQTRYLEGQHTDENVQIFGACGTRGMPDIDLSNEPGIGCGALPLHLPTPPSNQTYSNEPGIGCGALCVDQYSVVG